MEILHCWLLFSFIAGAIASNKGNSFIGAFLISILLSPIIGIIIALVQRPNEKAIEKKHLQTGDHKKCPFCAETIKAEAAVCRFCGRDVTATAQTTTTQASVPAVHSRATPTGTSPVPEVHDDVYYYSDGTDTHGPHTLVEMRRFFRDHQITATTQVYHSQFDWKPAYSLKIWG